MNMMKVQRWLDEILINPMLDEIEQEEKIIQLTDLIRFLETYKPSIEIMDYTKSVNIVKDEFIRKGILFFDRKVFSNPSVYSSFFSHSYLEIIKIQNNIDELWFVFVDDSLNSGDQKILDFFKENNVKDLYDEVFLFDFFESLVNKIS